MKNKIHSNFQFCLSNGLTQMMADGTYLIYSETHNASLDLFLDVKGRYSGESLINNLSIRINTLQIQNKNLIY